MRPESAVEPTRSENMTVTWRRSAVSWALGSVPTAGSVVNGAALLSSPIARKIFRRWIAKDRDTDPVFSKALHVLGHAELFKPLFYQLHCIRLGD